VAANAGEHRAGRGVGRGVGDRSPSGYRGGVHLKRVIPCLDVHAARVVKGVEFVDVRDAGDPVELAAHYDREGADELVFLDITATHEERETIVALARRTADDVFVPFTIGGGIRSLQDAQAVLDAGADKVSVNSAALARPELIDELAHVLGAQCVVLAIDAKACSGARGEADGGVDGGAGREDDGGAGYGTRWEAYLAGGRTPAGRDVVEWAQEGTERGAGEILLTSMDRDGTHEGYDLALVKAVSEAVPVPVIASGGAGELEHLASALHAGADAVLCASIFHYGSYTIAQAKAYLAEAGIAVRRA
jgi:imidazole glycerol-phosphate synthase subunit HisF